MASGKTLQSTIEISGVLSPSLQAAINNAVKKLEDMSEETLKSVGAAEKLSAEIGTQESVLKSLQKGYADYIVSGQESSTEAQLLADKIQELSGELDENREVLRAAERAATSFTHSQTDTADVFTKLERKINSQEDELESLRREYANVVLEQGKGSKEARQLANKISDLSGELNENKQKLNEAERVTDRWGNSLEDAGEKAENSSEGYTVLKNVIANLATEAISKAVEGFKELALEGDTALGKLEARTGATSSEMEGFEDVMYEVYNGNYGDSLGAVSETLSTVVQMTDDLDNASLAKITKNSIALDEVFGFDTVESLRAVNSLMDQFGITSDQAYNLIVQGAQNGLNQNDDLLDTINEYSVQFKNAGYTADDMFNMLANGTESGTWSVDKLGDAVKEFNIRMSDGTANDWLKELGVDAEGLVKQFNKGGPEAQAAIGKVMQAIKDCDDETLQYQAGVGLFGTMWEDLGADTVGSLMQTEGAIKSTADAMSQVDTAAYDTLESSLSQLGRTVKSEVVQPITEELTPVLKTAVDVVNNNVGPVVDWLLRNLPTLGVILAGVAAAVVAFKWDSIVSGIKSAVGAFKAFGAALASNPIGLIILAITALVAAFVYLWNNCESFREFWINLWNKIKESAAAIFEWLKNSWQSVASFFSETWEKIKAFFTGDNPIARYFQMGWENIKIVWGVAVSYFKTIWENIKLVFSVVKSVLSGNFSDAWAGIKQIFANWGSFFSGLWNSVKSIFGNVGSFFSGVWNNAKEIVRSAIDKIKGFFNFSWSLPKLKLPHFSIDGKFSLNPPSVPKFKIDWYKDGGILTQPTIFGAAGNTLLAGGEAGAEAVLPLALLWDKMEAILRNVFNGASSTGDPSEAGLTSKAGELLTLDDFSLGSLVDGTNVVIYYDFSNFTWSPQIQTDGSGDEDDLMAQLKAHEAEFFDWLEEFIQMREVAQYA